MAIAVSDTETNSEFDAQEPPLRVTRVMKSFGGGMDAGRMLPWGRKKKREPARRVVDDVSLEIRRG